MAVDTDDHKYPRGTWNDNTRRPRFAAACERQFGPRLHYLDLGCAGGGLVLRGHLALGLEGSDRSLLAQRAEWRLLPRNLFTADITKRFSIRVDGVLGQFQVITAWEVLEHIADVDLPELFNNLRQHLADDGVFIGSITCIADGDPETGAEYHRTVKSRNWWERRFLDLGFESVRDHRFQFEDFCRGVGNGWFDGDFRKSPDLGFHFVLRKTGASD